MITAAVRYGKKTAQRQAFLLAAHKAAMVTIPFAFPTAHDAVGQDDIRDELPLPNQELGSRAVNNLTEKIHLTVLPPNVQLMKYEPTPATKLRLSDDELDELNNILGERERLVTASIDSAKYRSKLSPIARQLIIAGNVLIHHTTDFKLKWYRLNRYVVTRNHDGEVREIVLREDLDYYSLDDAARAHVDSYRMDKANNFKGDLDEDVAVYTWIKMRDGQQKWHQEIHDKKVANSDGSAPSDAPAWIAATMYLEDGQHYGRGHVELYQGAWDVFDTLSQAMNEDAVAMSQTNPLVDPEGITDIKDLEEADNLQAISGRVEDIGYARVEKGGDFNAVLQVLQRLESGLSFAYLLNSAVRRQAERVTAEEIREIAQELETSLGGFYSTTSEEIQLPIVTLHERELERQESLPELPRDQIKPVIMTGLESIGRGLDATNLLLLAQDLQIWAPVFDTKLGQGLKPMELFHRLATARSVDTSGLVMTEEELNAMLQEQDQNAQIQELVKALGPNAINAMSEQAIAAQGAPNGS